MNRKKAIEVLEALSDCNYIGSLSGEDIESLEMAIDTMRKYQMMQADYENRLKADLKAILVDLQLEIREHDPGCGWDGYADKNVIDCIIQQRINSLKVEGEPRESEET